MKKEIDIAEYDTIEECLASMDEIERDVAVNELYRDGYWDSLRANGERQEDSQVV